MIEKIIDLKSKAENIGGLFTVVYEFGRIDHETEFIHSKQSSDVAEYTFETETIKIKVFLSKKLAD